MPHLHVMDSWVQIFLRTTELIFKLKKIYFNPAF